MEGGPCGQPPLSMKVEEEYLDVLQNIDFTLVSYARHDPSIDDDVVDRALQVCMHRTDAADDADPRVLTLCEALERMRGSREDVADNIWRAALRTVDESVRAHSDLMPGEKTYLQFIEPYV